MSTGEWVMQLSKLVLAVVVIGLLVAIYIKI